MSKKRKENLPEPVLEIVPGYDQVLGGVVQLLEQARRASARVVNAFITATYWDIGRRIVEFEQGGSGHAQYGTLVVTRLAADLTLRFGRGFHKSNLYQMRSFYLVYRGIFQTPSGKSDIPVAELAKAFPLPWSHYVLLLKVEKPKAREFYEAEAHRNGWTVRHPNPVVIVLRVAARLPSSAKVPQPAAFLQQAVAKVQQAVAQLEPGDLLWSIPWFHQVILLEKVKNLDHRMKGNQP